MVIFHFCTAKRVAMPTRTPIQQEDVRTLNVENMPIDALAFLKGLGWTEGKAIGKRDTGLKTALKAKLRDQGKGVSRSYVAYLTLSSDLPVKTTMICQSCIITL